MIALLYDYGILNQYCHKSSLAHRERAGVRGSESYTLAYLSPHPDLLPEGEGTTPT